MRGLNFGEKILLTTPAACVILLCTPLKYEPMEAFMPSRLFANFIIGIGECFVISLIIPFVGWQTANCVKRM